MQLRFNEKFSIDADKFLTSRSCVIGQSGSGKSYAIGVICEELCKKKLGFSIIDPEGEYVGLKEKFDVIWVSDDNRAEVNIENTNFNKQIVPIRNFIIIALKVKLGNLSCYGLRFTPISILYTLCCLRKQLWEYSQRQLDILKIGWAKHAIKLHLRFHRY